MRDLVIIGAGPAGISAAYEAQKAGLDYVVIEKGLIGNTIYNYPIGLTVFSTPDELELNRGDLKPCREKPTREELLSYYVRFVLDNGLNVRTEEKVLAVGLDAVSGKNNSSGESELHHPFVVRTNKATETARNVLFATGAMEYPRRLNVPGEDLSFVHHQFRETYPWVRKRALVIGGGNSAGEAALFLAEEGAETTLAIFRQDWENTDPKQGCIKYWVKQPLEEQINRRCLTLFFLGKVLQFDEGIALLESEDGESAEIPVDVVFVLIGAEADLSLLVSLGIRFENSKHGKVPIYNPETFETEIPGIYVAGHFTHQRHIKGAIEAGRTVINSLKSSLAGNLKTV
ncbi:MAG TPA: FAD-dependent oxidoreductase [Pyrinomonadaceae bacterium]|nr:FAD-dependent oxidoreductase [Pyrinomonadaceae bacterium]